MSAQHNLFAAANPQQGSSALSKRKRGSWCVEDFTYEQNKQMRTRSPRLDRRHTYQDAPPDLVTDSSATASDEDQAMDQDMDMSSDADHDMDMGMDESGGGGFEYENGAVDARMRRESMDDGQGANYSFGSGGSGGFGFGPGAMEDEDDEGSEGSGKPTYPCQPYPSLTPHTNPNHFSNQPFSIRPKSPLSAQPYSTSLRAPRAPGLLQPTSAGPLAPNANDVERARAQHGPQCRSIPKLVLSQYPDPVSGERSMWTHCGDCGAMERSM
ncbi:uncharacterized protein MKK02DRAFT_40025 [Dioszegia hungarica]|uniref:Uncharacterized protein n=1 Tax=Dioszegia hungarica TaxID=4972 RepID=A0AA38LY93_9TREE|nr:uncharacterized protein MKK02DRAFT_40025 [Dioszegia hungarica]KAI9639703.1 hypothetical protein MKK02DRAFT_40025 [Dioszegia hungarica]